MMRKFMKVRYKVNLTNTPQFKVTAKLRCTYNPLSRGETTVVSNSIKRKLGCVIGVFALLFSLGSQAQSLNQSLQNAFNRLQQDTQNTYASVSLTVLDAKTGEVIFTANPNMGLATASTLKTITTVTVMNVLGPDYRFKTTLNGSLNGTLTVDGTWNGDIIINGGDDPTLASTRWDETKESVVLQQFVDGLRKAGIKKINGAIIGNGTDHAQQGWIWQDLGNYYGAFANNLCWRENQYDVLLRPTQVDRPVAIEGTVPAMPYLQFSNQLKTGTAGSGDNAYARLPVGSNKVFLQGTYATDQTKRRISAALPDPAYEAARRLKDTLERLGISVSGNATSATMLASQNGVPSIASGKVFATHLSPPLRKVIYWLNKKSINLYAEQMLLAMGDSLKTDDPPSVTRNFWKQRGVDVNSLNIVDGSGLSPGDRVTTMTLARILQSAKKEAWFPDFYESLPIYNDMHMKSGTINCVLAYAGYQTKNGRELCFSIIVNNYNGSTSAIRQKMFRVLDELK
ncbi:D-alanyl-D-alanine carboxypeptidase/D-alanyl-D-alanine endopeptidase [Mucilaginibacter sp. KACC 22063]|uniref:D-alanyl-D-alanine carboxypeptidase/D-alanyl-D-alanine endopeptidase n=1 Tax=Mucilaginibacter sp. KACC 22063 TaxID=3025666 RepID=UPI002366EF65|nr:D-alanyl-D-alanine carboxypeptidase/D-alanyl-D-alanine-endopeptidase [Mucilaginibacter sp. KACC 22063]WDF54515.1 D-alanyl-D-alanine carboxypeptidase/D-alanyl-D-alanine-endopeptidase [Mucilaginibacter sp. KACC 22063]